MAKVLHLAPHREYCVYSYFYTDTQKVFYIGHGNNHRYRTKRGRGPEFDKAIEAGKWARSLLACNLTKHEAEDMERAEILRHIKAGHPLINKRYKGCITGKAN